MSKNKELLQKELEKTEKLMAKVADLVHWSQLSEKRRAILAELEVIERQEAVENEDQSLPKPTLERPF